tara:strand:+ start:1757 stop:1978 length:222 start_codon:yes stop_codon:yes gene_type:complete
MEGYILTIEQKEEIQGVFYTPYEFFNCVQDENDIWFLFLSEQDKETIVNTQWDWLLNLPQGEYVPKPIILGNE